MGKEPSECGDPPFVQLLNIEHRMCATAFEVVPRLIHQFVLQILIGEIRRL
jgi:hypothetical protein